VSPSVLRMPRLSDSMSEATIVAWLKQPGEAFVRGEPLVEVETDKATVVYEAEADGLLAEILVAEGVTASLGDPIARLGGDGDGDEPQAKLEVPQAAIESVQQVAEPRVAAAAQPAAAHPAPAARARATPVARRTAVQLGVALYGLTGTGPGGRIRQLDVLRAGGSAPPSETNGLKGLTTVVPLSTTGETIARRMAQSRSEIPSFEVVVQADMTTIGDLRKNAADLVETVPSVNDFVVKAVAAALREHPAFNSSFVDGRCERHGRVNVGVAVATDDALLVPAVMDADVKPLAVIAAETRDLVARARARRLTPEELTASTFTVSNLGMFDVRSFTAVINPPQVAILAVGAVARAPAETAMGGVTFRDVATLTLTSDHRAVYGADAARFLGRIRKLLEHPLALVLERPNAGSVNR
jgi:pyruvate dehydrogenase E2 component (dihydrolipoamide acetyltransferase)